MEDSIHFHQELVTEVQVALCHADAHGQHSAALQPGAFDPVPWKNIALLVDEMRAGNGWGSSGEGCQSRSDGKEGELHLSLQEHFSADEDPKAMSEIPALYTSPSRAYTAA